MIVIAEEFYSGGQVEGVLLEAGSMSFILEDFIVEDITNAESRLTTYKFSRAIVRRVNPDSVKPITPVEVEAKSARLWKVEYQIRDFHSNDLRLAEGYVTGNTYADAIRAAKELLPEFDGRAITGIQSIGTLAGGV